MRITRMEELINREMNHEKITQEKIARDVGIAPSKLTALKNTGCLNSNADTLIKLAKYFNVSADYLLELTDDESVKKEPSPMNIGLSEKSVSFLKSIVDDNDNMPWKRYTLLALNTLLESAYDHKNSLECRYVSRRNREMANKETVSMILMRLGELFEYLGNNPDDCYVSSDKDGNVICVNRNTLEADLSVSGITGNDFCASPRKYMMYDTIDRIAEELKAYCELGQDEKIETVEDVITDAIRNSDRAKDIFNEEHARLNISAEYEKAVNSGAVDPLDYTYPPLDPEEFDDAPNQFSGNLDDLLKK